MQVLPFPSLPFPPSPLPHETRIDNDKTTHPPSLHCTTQTLVNYLFLTHPSHPPLLLFFLPPPTSDTHEAVLRRAKLNILRERHTLGSSRRVSMSDGRNKGDGFFFCVLLSFLRVFPL
eukprot:TRINITY_DN2548_c0_g1_i1.p1 TRINITY_DN2548_c0_g1~~TRINITY_DN2548_c0_g1_i1.p1  ORF type:complete len:118 (+),score=1.75 TRINITY_DN2548_c0_g1_i1:220-573(+)